MLRENKIQFDVIMLSNWDWANTGYRFHQCALSLGLNAVFFKGKPHIFNYPFQGALHTELAKQQIIAKFPIIMYAPKLDEYVDNTKIVHFLASTFVDIGDSLEGKKIIIQHSGVDSLLYSNYTNSFFNPKVDLTIQQFSALMNNGSKNEVLCYYPIDTDFLRPSFEPMDDKLIIGHFPSSPKNKHTDIVLKAIHRLQSIPDYNSRFEYIGIDTLYKPGTSGYERSWLHNLNLMSKCDIIIESMSSRVYKGDLLPPSYSFTPTETDGDGKILGDFGNTALEVSALGKICITSFMHNDLYKKEYGQTPSLQIANSLFELEDKLKQLVTMSGDEIRHLKEQSRKWVEDCHSIKATAKRLDRLVYKPLLES